MKGVQYEMIGPGASQSISFDRQGWITEIEAFATDDQGHRLQDQSFLCHSTFHYGRVFEKRHPRLTLDEGVQTVRLPDGFGMPIRPDAPYRIDMMLQNHEPSLDRRLAVETRIKVRYEGDGPPLKSLVHFALAAEEPADHPKSVDAKDWAVWWLTPGHHRLERPIQLPVDGRVHFMTAHVHRYAVSIKLVDTDTGKILFEGRPVEDSKRNLLSTPIYSSAEGFPVRANQPLMFSVDYDIPPNTKAIAMATLHLLLHPDREGDWDESTDRSRRLYDPEKDDDEEEVHHH